MFHSQSKTCTDITTDICNTIAVTLSRVAKNTSSDWVYLDKVVWKIFMIDYVKHVSMVEICDTE